MVSGVSEFFNVEGPINGNCDGTDCSDPSVAILSKDGDRFEVCRDCLEQQFQKGEDSETG